MSNLIDREEVLETLNLLKAEFEQHRDVLSDEDTETHWYTRSLGQVNAIERAILQIEKLDVH